MGTSKLYVTALTADVTLIDELNSKELS